MVYLKKARLPRVVSLEHFRVPRLKLDGRKRSKTTDHINNGHSATIYQDQQSLQAISSDGSSGRPRSFTLDSSDQFVVVDNISIDESVSMFVFMHTFTCYNIPH